MLSNYLSLFDIFDFAKIESLPIYRHSMALDGIFFHFHFNFVLHSFLFLTLQPLTSKI